MLAAAVIGRIQNLLPGEFAPWLRRPRIQSPACKETYLSIAEGLQVCFKRLWLPRWLPVCLEETEGASKCFRIRLDIVFEVGWNHSFDVPLGHPVNPVQYLDGGPIEDKDLE